MVSGKASREAKAFGTFVNASQVDTLKSDFIAMLVPGSFVNAIKGLALALASTYYTSTGEN